MWSVRDPEADELAPSAAQGPHTARARSATAPIARIDDGASGVDSHGRADEPAATLEAGGAGSAATPSPFAPWAAELSLALHSAQGRTRLQPAVHHGPLRVQRPFYPEGPNGPCHVYVLHPPGGLVSGDQLRLQVQLERDARALLTTPGASKLYRARGGAPVAASGRLSAGAGELTAQPGATARQLFQVGPGAQLEWFPHETIAYDGARGRVQTEVELSEGATYAGWELLCLGRPASGERFTRGELRSELVVRRSGRLLYVERGHYRGGDLLLDAHWGLGGQPVLATFVLAAPRVEATWVDAVRAAVRTDDPAAEAEVEPGLFSVTLVSGALIARFLGRSTRRARVLFQRVYGVLRPLYAGRVAVHPRIWST